MSQEPHALPLRTAPNDAPKWRYRKTKRLIYYILGLLETLLAFRLVLKLLGANPASGFVKFIYGVTGVFIAPFTAIFSPVVSQGLETRSFLEPATITAMLIYALIVWGIIKLIDISRDRHH